jgi:hypothetical protein
MSKLNDAEFFEPAAVSGFITPRLNLAEILGFARPTISRR